MMKLLRKMLPVIVCLAAAVAMSTAMADTIPDVPGAMIGQPNTAPAGYEAVTYSYNVADNVATGADIGTDNWKNLSDGSSSTGVVTAAFTGTIDDGEATQKDYAFDYMDNNGDGGRRYRQNDGNFSFSIPADAKEVIVTWVSAYQHPQDSTVLVGLGKAGVDGAFLCGHAGSNVAMAWVDGGGFDATVGLSGVTSLTGSEPVEFKLKIDFEGTHGADGTANMLAYAENTGDIDNVSKYWKYWGDVNMGLTGWDAKETSDSIYLYTDGTDTGPGQIDITVIQPVIPEPGTITLLGMSLLGLVFYGWRRRK